MAATPGNGSVFRTAAVTTTDSGNPRRVGVELEFSGIDLETASVCVAQSLGGERCRDTAAEHSVDVPGLGRFQVEIDWDFLKRSARSSAEGETKEWVEPLSRAAEMLVPVEVVGPPVPMHLLERLTPMITALREAGAVGTEESLIAAYGVHLNPEISSLEPAVIHRYLRAFALLQWWLVAAHDVDPMRRVTPYIDLWPEKYLREVLTLREPDAQALIDHYLKHNPTRNRALDMLPLFAEIDADRVQATVDDVRVKPRPTFHYRMPNCHIERDDWSLASAWNLWCVVEALAWDNASLDALTSRFLDADRLLIGVARADWVTATEQWLHDRGLA